MLKHNPYIKRVLIWDALTLIQLQYEYFDVVINLEKVPGLAALADNIRSANIMYEEPDRYGYWFNNITGEIGKRYKSGINWNAGLFGIVGKKYNNEQYILGYKPKTDELDLIGLNFMVGNKWPQKRWTNKNGFHMLNWIQLKDKLISKEIIEMQPEESDLYNYIDWINRCNLLVTCDSLGLHIAMALNKKVVALFGPTPVFKEAYGPGRQCIIAASGKMEDISVDVVYEGIKYILQYG